VIATEVSQLSVRYAAKSNESQIDKPSIPMNKEKEKEDQCRNRSGMG